MTESLISQRLRYFPLGDQPPLTDEQLYKHEFYVIEGMDQ
jgi:hypothetical protein